MRAVPWRDATPGRRDSRRLAEPDAHLDPHMSKARSTTMRAQPTDPGMRSPDCKGSSFRTHDLVWEATLMPTPAAAQ